MPWNEAKETHNKEHRYSEGWADQQENDPPRKDRRQSNGGAGGGPLGGPPGGRDEDEDEDESEKSLEEDNPEENRTRRSQMRRSQSMTPYYGSIHNVPRIPPRMRQDDPVTNRLYTTDDTGRIVDNSLE